jgi:hypothetical protein
MSQIRTVNDLSWNILTVSALIGLEFMGSTLVTPLYRGYQSAFGFTDFTLTLGRVVTRYVLMDHQFKTLVMMPCRTPSTATTYRTTSGP